MIKKKSSKGRDWAFCHAICWSGDCRRAQHQNTHNTQLSSLVRFPPPVTAMEMEIDSDSAKHIKKEELFKAAESGDSSLFKSLAEERLHRALSLRNEDGRSLLHVAVSSSQIDVQFVIRLSLISSSASYIVLSRCYCLKE